MTKTGAYSARHCSRASSSLMAPQRIMKFRDLAKTRVGVFVYWKPPSFALVNAKCPKATSDLESELFAEGPLIGREDNFETSFPGSALNHGSPRDGKGN
jgi:hypothetical protein